MLCPSSEYTSPSNRTSYTFRNVQYVMSEQSPVLSGKTVNVSILHTKYMLVTTAISVTTHAWGQNGSQNNWLKTLLQMIQNLMNQSVLQSISGVE